MADELEALLERVDDDGLRSELRDHIERLRRRRQFGLVFESHLPERVRLPDHPIRRGSKVVRRGSPAREAPQEVLRVKGDKVVLAIDDGTEEVASDDLVVVTEFGEPIYPGLRRLGSIDRGGDKPAHVVIKGENYHALEALRFTHAGKVDCIYIDPPYNTGARDWKYDNDYVDAEDGYRHSKWLAFMERARCTFPEPVELNELRRRSGSFVAPQSYRFLGDEELGAMLNGERSLLRKLERQQRPGESQLSG